MNANVELRCNPDSDALKRRDEPGKGDDVPCVKCGGPGRINREPTAMTTKDANPRSDAPAAEPLALRLNDQLGQFMPKPDRPNIWGGCYSAEAMRAYAEKAASMEWESRAMFVARLENLSHNGDKWLTVEAVLALLNDCDMLATRA